MKRCLTTLIICLAGFFLYFAWADYTEKQFAFSKYEGEVIQKVRSEDAIDMGVNITTKVSYCITLSTGEVISVSYPVFQKLNKGDFTILLRNHEQVIISKLKKHTST
jgi:hypothetical protein